MERNIISWNLPNLITVPLMAAIAFLVVSVAWQLISKGVAGAKSANAPDAGSANNGGGY